MISGRTSHYPTTSEYLLEENTPIFSKEAINITSSASITHAVLANDYLVLSTLNGQLIRRDLKKSDAAEELSYSQYIPQTTKLSNIFLDPLGQHLLLSASPKNKNEGDPELFYLHRSSNKIRAVSKSRGQEVTAVGWNHNNASQTSTGIILLGTSQGHIVESEFTCENDKMYQTVRKHVFDVGKGTNSPVTGIEFHRVNSTNKYIIMITTPERLYNLVGHANPDDKPLLQSIFNSYLNIPEIGFQEILSGLSYSKLQFIYDKNKNPKMFCWLTGQGIFYGELDLASEDRATNIFINGKMLSYPRDDNDNTPPLSFVLTDFHALLVYPDKIKAMCLLNEQLAYEDSYDDTRGTLKAIVKDPLKQTIMAVTNKSIYRYQVVREERNIWKIYCDKQQYDLAKQFCGNNPVYIDSINVRQADMLFSQGLYEQSGSIYAVTESSFETICLKFLGADQIDALKIYLEKRLENLDDDKEIVIAGIVVWMCELYLSQLAAFRLKGEQASHRYALLQNDFEIFLLLPQVMNCIDKIKPALYDIARSHGDYDNYVKLALLNEDYDVVIEQYMHRKMYLEALDVMKNHSTISMIYDYAHVLMQEIPTQTVDALIALGPKLKPSQLLPAFLSCRKEAKRDAEIIRYLEFVLLNFYVKEKAMHNYLISLYCEHDTDALIRYLNRQGQELSEVKYDVYFALRLCKKKGLTVASVKLSALLGMWESAVELALTVDQALAKSIANMPHDDKLKKKLWLKIAQHVISAKQDVGEATGLLEECSLIKIEDILPLFSNMVTIDQFRDSICRALQEYNTKIEELKVEMEEATKSAEQVRQEIKSFRERSTLVLVSDTCSLCCSTLVLKPFYLFPCGHKFHSVCLLKEVTPLLGSAKQSKLESIRSQLSNLSAAELSASASSGLTLREQLMCEVDETVGGECLFCGERGIQAIDKPFILDGDWERVAREWE